MRVAWSLFVAAFGATAARGEVHRGIAAGGESEPGEVPVEVWCRGTLVGLAFVRGPSAEETDLAWSEAVGAAARLASGVRGPAQTTTVMVPRLRARAPALSAWSAVVSSDMGRVRFAAGEGVSPESADDWPPVPDESVSMVVSCAGSPRTFADTGPVVFAMAGAAVGLLADGGSSWAASVHATGDVDLRTRGWTPATSGFEATARVRRSASFGIEAVGGFAGFGAYAGWQGELLVGAEGALGLRAHEVGDVDSSLTG